MWLPLIRRKALELGLCAASCKNCVAQGPAAFTSERAWTWVVWPFSLRRVACH